MMTRTRLRRRLRVQTAVFNTSSLLELIFTLHGQDERAKMFVINRRFNAIMTRQNVPGTMLYRERYRRFVLKARALGVEADRRLAIAMVKRDAFRKEMQ